MGICMAVNNMICFLIWYDMIWYDVSWWNHILEIASEAFTFRAMRQHRHPPICLQPFDTWKDYNLFTNALQCYQICTVPGCFPSSTPPRQCQTSWHKLTWSNYLKIYQKLPGRFHPKRMAPGWRVAHRWWTVCANSSSGGCSGRGSRRCSDVLMFWCSDVRMFWCSDVLEEVLEDVVEDVDLKGSWRWLWILFKWAQLL